MYSRNKGKSGSTRPSETKKASWEKYKKEEVEALVVKLGKQGLESSKIGLVLRDSYGIRDVKLLTSKKIYQILEDNKLTRKVPEDLIALIRRNIKILDHIETNKKDMTAKRGLQLTESKIRRLVKYYKEVGKLDASWKYTREGAKLLVG